MLGFVLRLPRWWDRCLPFTYTAMGKEVVSSRCSSKTPFRPSCSTREILTSVVAVGDHLDGMLVERSEETECDQGRCVVVRCLSCSSSTKSKVDALSENWACVWH